jgi:hypothetical protein
MPLLPVGQVLLSGDYKDGVKHVLSRFNGCPATMGANLAKLDGIRRISPTTIIVYLA